MDKNQIIEIIKANPQLSFDEVKMQGKEAGLSSGKITSAWEKVQSEKDDFEAEEHDKRVGEIIKEIKGQGKTTRTAAEWKTHFKNKGYGDDECDLGYVLCGAKINYGPLHPLLTFFLLGGLGIGLTIFLLKQYGGESDIPEIGMHLAYGGPVIYGIYLMQQFRKFSKKVIEFDFQASSIKNTIGKLKEWKTLGSDLMKYQQASIGQLMKTSYDGRETLFGEFSYTVGSGKHKKTVNYFMVAQKAHKEFPTVHALRPSADRHFLKKEVHLEGVEFNKRYNIYADNPPDAFYVFNPRVMEALLEKEVLDDIRSFETVGDEVLLMFKSIPMWTGIRFKQPIIRYKDYQNIKRKMLHALDLATDINDVFARQIVDEGDERSVAKEI